MIYAAHVLDGLFIKIGYCAKNVDRRIAQLQTGSPFLISPIFTVAGNLMQEKAIHKSLTSMFLIGKHQVPPNEWYPGGSELFTSFLFYLRDSAPAALAFLDSVDPSVVKTSRQIKAEKWSTRDLSMPSSIEKPILEWPSALRVRSTKKLALEKKIVGFLTR